MPPTSGSPVSGLRSNQPIAVGQLPTPIPQQQESRQPAPAALNLRSSPPRRPRFFFRAKPALAMRGLDSRLVVIALSGHVVDPLALGADIALDVAGRVLLRCHEARSGHSRGEQDYAYEMSGHDFPLSQGSTGLPADRLPAGRKFESLLIQRAGRESLSRIDVMIRRAKSRNGSYARKPRAKM
jgi:hypothetical protein